MICSRCGVGVPRTSKAQRYCPRCEREVAYITEQDAKRRGAKVWRPKVFTDWAVR